jgi:hypothetical protein
MSLIAQLQVFAAPAHVAWARVRRRPLQSLALLLSIATAGAVIGVSGLLAALAAERHTKLELARLPITERTFNVEYQAVGARQLERLDSTTARSFRAVSKSFAQPTYVHALGPIHPADERGFRLVEADPFASSVVLFSGRLPHPCRSGVCEVMSLDPSIRVGRTLRLGSGVRVRVVGGGTLARSALPSAGLLGSHGLLVRSIAEVAPARLRAVTQQAVVATAILRPEAIHVWQLDSLAEALRRETVRLQRSAPSAVASAPTGVLHELARTTRVARQRLVLVAGEGAALILAFAAFAAAARREDYRLAERQLETLGASRTQLLLARICELALPALLGGVLALVCTYAASALVAWRRGFPGAFVAEAFPAETAAAVLALTIVGAIILTRTTAHRRRARFGPLELAASVALALVVWQATANGGLDPARLARGESGAPFFLLVPALAVLVAGVVALRLLPVCFRVAERAARRGPFALRLALLSAARNPAQAAAAATFLSVAIGSALFSLDYRASLQRQAHDAAAFAAGAQVRVSEQGPFGSSSVAPLTRYRLATQELPTPVLRQQGQLRESGGAAEGTPVAVLGIPAARLPTILGWRRSFSALDRGEIAQRLRPRPIALGGPRVAADARALQISVRARTASPRRVVLHFMLPGDAFAQLTLGQPRRNWTLLHGRLPPRLRRAQLVGIGFPVAPGGIETFDNGFIELGDLQERTSTGWQPLSKLAGWGATKSTTFGGYLQPQSLLGGRRAIRGRHFSLGGTTAPFIRPALALPAQLPALAGPTVAAASVDGVATVSVLGQNLRVRIVAQSSLLPTVTSTPSSFIVIDYATLFAVLNLDNPGQAPPSEAWFFRPPSTFSGRLSNPPFRLNYLVDARRLEARFSGSPLAEGSMRVLLFAALIAAALAVIGLVLATRSTIDTESALNAEYEALGVPPRTLNLSIRLRLLLLSALGVGAALSGALLATRLVGALVAVTAGAGVAIPPIVPIVAWAAGGALIVAVAVAALTAAAALVSRELRAPSAGRLRG